MSWKSKKQTVVARSKAEAEYRAMANVTCELGWLKSLPTDFSADHSGAGNPRNERSEKRDG